MRRGQATSYVRILEQSVTALQQQLQDAGHAVPGTSGSPRPPSRPASPLMFADLPFALGSAPQPQRQQQPSIDLIVHAGDDLVIGTRFYRFSAVLNILRTIADMLTANQKEAATPDSVGLAIVEAIDTPLEVPVRDTIDWLDVVMPPRVELHRLISCTINRALVCHHCINERTFVARVDELYSPSRTHVVAKNKSFISLIYAALALGERYSTEDEDNTTRHADPAVFPSG